MYQSKNTDTGWILCPSKSFPGKFYYFNVATGETAWCLNENERKLLKNPPIQKADLQHCYPEPCSPPAEETTAHNQHTIIPYHEETIPTYNQDTSYRNLYTNMVQPYDQLSNSVPCQIQLPMIYQGDGNMPQVIMIVMNQAMRRLTIGDPRQGRQPSQAVGPVRASMPNQPWNEPSQSHGESNQSPIDSNVPDRKLFIHTGKKPLCERFENFKKSNLEFKDSKFLKPNPFDLPSNKNQHNLSYKTPNAPFGHKQSVKMTGHPNVNQNTLLREPILNFAKNKTQYGNTNFNFAKQCPGNIESNPDEYMQSTSHSFSDHKVFTNLKQNFSQGLIRQPLANRDDFEQRQKNNVHFRQNDVIDNIPRKWEAGKQLFEQSLTNKGLIGQGRTDHEPLNQKHLTNKEPFRESQANKVLFGQTQTNKVAFGQNQTSKHIFGQNQTKQQNFNGPETFQSSSVEPNLFQKLIAEKSTPKQSSKVDFPKSPQSCLDTQKLENCGTVTEEKAAVTLDGKVESSQETDLLNLDKNDLRRTLMNKKRKSNIAKTVEAKKIKIGSKEDSTVTLSKKKVSFNLSPEFYSDSGNGDVLYKDVDDDEEMPPNSEIWYVITDAKTLLEHFDALNSFVKSDPKCNLIIPSQVMSDIVILSRGECRDRNHVTLARHLLRALATPQRHIILQQSKDETLDISTDDSILNCCLEIMEKTNVILITDDEELQRTAEYLNVNYLTCDQIKNGHADQSKVFFDVGKVKISITNEPDIEIPIQKMKELSFCMDSDKNDRDSNDLCFENQTTNEDIENDSKVNPFTFQIQKNPNNFNTTTKSNISLPNETTFPIQNKEKEIDTYKGNIVSESQNMTTYFPKNEGRMFQKREGDVSSIFKQTNKAVNNTSIFAMDNDKLTSKNGSIFKVDGIEKLHLHKEGQLTNSIFKSNWPATEQLLFSNNESKNTENKGAGSEPPVFEKGKYENGGVQSKPLIFNKEHLNQECQSTYVTDDTYKNRLNPKELSIINRNPFENNNKPHIFGTLAEGGQLKPTNKEGNFTNVKNKFLDQFLKRFYDTHRIFEPLVEKWKLEIDCNFKQVMENCLNDVLHTKINVIKLKLLPPWTLPEALRCLADVYSNHTYIRDVVELFLGISDVNSIPGKDVIKFVGCGLALVKYLKFIAPTIEVLKDAEESLNSILLNLNVDIDVEPETPVFNPTDTGGVQTNKQNFVKERSDLVNYLKKHFPSWADYDETLDENASTTCRKDYKNTMIVRTYGKNLGLLKLNNSRAMTLEYDSSQHVDRKTPENEQQSINRHVNFENCKSTEAMDIEIINSDEIFVKDSFKGMKLTRVVENTSAKVLKDNAHDHKVKSKEGKQMNEFKRTEPKVVRLLNDIDLTKEYNTNKSAEKFDFLSYDFETQGHTFGAKEEGGPKIIRNHKPIKEFEKKFMLGTNSSEVDEIMLRSDENNNLNSDSTNNNCLSMTIENVDIFGQKKHLNGTNDCLDANDSRNFNNNRDSNSAVNEIFEKSITNNIYDTLDIEKILSTNYINKTTNDMNFESDFNSNFVGYDVDAVDDFKRSNHANFGNGTMNDMTLARDNMTNDSGFENASQQTYFVMNTFLCELKLAFKSIHKFLGNSIRKIRCGPFSSMKHVRNTASTTQAHIEKIMVNLRCIIQRETSSGPLIKKLVEGAGWIADNDERIPKYREIVTKCYEHARLLDKIVNAIVNIIDDRKR